MIKIQNDSIRSERLLMRPLTVKDADDMFEFTRLPESSEFLLWKPHKSVKEDELFIQNALQDKESFYWGIQHLETGKLIGNIHVYDIELNNMKAEISCILHPQYGGKGFASEAFRAVLLYLLKRGFVRVQALCIDDHVKSEKMMMRAGMSYEGTLRNYIRLKGKVRNMKLYSICN